MRFERPPQEHVDDEPKDASKRAFLGWLGQGAVVAAGAALMREQVFAESERNVGTWQSGAREMKELVMHPGQAEVSKVFVPDASGDRGEWFTETENRIDGVTVSKGAEDFVRKAIEEKRPRAIKCHLHPSQPGEAPLRDAEHPEGNEYPESYPPSFMMSLNEGDAVAAWTTDNHFANKIDLEYKVFDRRGVWTYSVDYKHSFWQAFGEVQDLALDASDEIKKVPECNAAWQRCVHEHTFGLEAFKDFMTKMPHMPQAVRAQCEAFVVGYDVKLVKVYGDTLAQHKKANDEFILGSSKVEFLNWRDVRNTSAQLGMKIFFVPYEGLGL